MALRVATPQRMTPRADAAAPALHYPMPTVGRTLRHVPIAQIIKRRDAMIWRLTGFEHEIAARNLEQFWQILDEMMDVSEDSAMQMLEDTYNAHFRKLQPYEQRREYPGVRQQVYRMAYCERHKPCEDFTSGTLVEHALDVLQEQAYALL